MSDERARRRAVEEVKQHRTAQVLQMHTERVTAARAELARLRRELLRLADDIECGDVGLGGDVAEYARILRDLAASEAA